MLIICKGELKFIRMKQVSSSVGYATGYCAESGDTDRYGYECPYGKGKIVEEHDNMPGF